MFVQKRDGSKEPVRFDKITERISRLRYGLDAEHVEPVRVTQKIIDGVYEGVTTVQLDELAAETCASMTTLHPDYSVLAARIAVSNLHKQTKSSFTQVIRDLHDYYNPELEKVQPMISEEVLDIVNANSDKLEAAIKYERDFEFNYFGFKTLERSYLLKVDGRVAERPQHLLMRVSIGIHGDDIDRVLETYEMMSLRYFTHGSPTLFNAGTVRPQMASCFLVAMQDDSIEGIYDTLKECALISKSAGGIGMHVHNIRAAGTYIAGTNGTSNGIIPMLRVFNNTARYVDQGGNKRPGAIAVYLEPWHADIFDFIDIRKNHGKEEIRARDLFPALWIPDLFMERVQKNESWTLFSPNEAPGLSDAYGDEFVNLYTKYEKAGKGRLVVKAQKLWYSILEAQTETGTPFMLYKDACNKKSNQQNLGTIKSSNLCCEIVEYSEPGETAVCNLGSIALPAFVDIQGKIATYNFKKLHAVAKVLTRNLNRVIDRNYYPVESAKVSNFKNRPIALGVQGLADTFAVLRIPFDSESAQALNVQIFETIYHAAVEASCELAESQGCYETYEGSPASQGLLQFDLWDVKPSALWDWTHLKQRVAQHGLRNSLLVAPMPTASTSQILGYNECFEPFTSNIYTRRVLAGEFQIVNPYLLRDLVDLGAWNDDMKSHIIAHNGSIQGLPNIPAEIKSLYKTVWEIPQKTIIDMSAARAPFIDQSQSLNIHIKDPTMGKLTSMHFHGWKKGLKTGMYYLRTQAASAAIQFTVDAAAAQNAVTSEVNAANLHRPTYRSVADVADTPTKGSPETDAEFTPGEVDIYSAKAIACAIDDPDSCEMCSG